MGSTQEQHERDHERLDGTYEAWVRAGRPKTANRNRNKAQLARTLGLRIAAHLDVLHRRHDLQSTPANLATYDQLMERHNGLHEEEEAR